MTSRHKAVDRKPPDGWSFTLAEVTAGMGRAKGVGPDGLVIDRHGADDDVLLGRLIEDAWKLSA